MSKQPIISDHEEQHLSYGKYTGGFVASIALTLSAYWLVTRGSTNQNVLVVVLVVLALIQFIVQMVLFLHIADERGPRWKLATAGMMITIVLILVFGSIWVMNNLNYRMTPKQILQYMQSQDNL